MYIMSYNLAYLALFDIALSVLHTLRLRRTWLDFASSLLVEDGKPVCSVLDPAIAVEPVTTFELLVVTIVDIVDEDDNGFEVVPPPERVPEMYSMQDIQN